MAGKSSRDTGQARPGHGPDAGGALLYAVAGITLLAALAAAAAQFTSGALDATLAGGRDSRAYYLALSGLNFWSVGKTGVYALGDGSFDLSQSGPDAQGYYTVTSLGTYLSGTAAAARHSLTVRRKASRPITFDDDIDDFTPPVVGSGGNSRQAILVFDNDLPDAPAGWSEADWASLWLSNANRYAGGWVQMGGGATDTAGAVWYGGDHGVCEASPCQPGVCRSGACTLGQGLRAYFRFVFSCYDDYGDSTACADGFTFAVVTSRNNPATAAGGPARGSMGELLGYAGPGPEGQGIVPPKLAVEVDTYPNKGRGRSTDVNSRRDADDDNHVAVVYWGSDDTSYDDNVHGVGDNPAPRSAGYVAKAKAASGANWLEDGQPHAMRLEVHRADASDGGVYRVKVWIDPTGAGAADVTADYRDQTPLLEQATTLARSAHAGLDVVRFGWTEGTGGAAQTVAVYDFSLDFRR